jgi:hypothetical protein
MQPAPERQPFAAYQSVSMLYNRPHKRLAGSLISSAANICRFARILEGETTLFPSALVGGPLSAPYSGVVIGNRPQDADG